MRFGPLPVSVLRKLSDADGWMLLASQGQLDVLSEYQDESVEQLRGQAIRSLKMALSGHQIEALEQMKQHFSDREHIQSLVRFWFQFVRDIWFLKKGLTQDLIHTDLVDELGSLESLSERKLIGVSQQLIELNEGLYGNLDKRLSVENFFYNGLEVQSL